MKNTLVIFIALILSSFSGDKKTSQVKTLLEEDISYLVEFYKKRHQNPEISLEEKETSKDLAAELRKVGFEVTENFGGYGIVAILKNGKGPTILYRTDMDALPMYEKTELDYLSKKTTTYNGEQIGTMHSCGHDIHMTTLLGTGRMMAKIKDKWKGTLMLIGQPAEETGQGAKMMLDAGLYEKFGVPNYAVALHSSPTLEAGKVGFGKGYTMANTESIDINVFGIGAHGASPHKSIDPIVTASMLVMELQTIVSRNLKPTKSAVITVGSIKGGNKHNVIPEKVTLKLTIRTYSEEVRLFIHKRIKEVAKGVAIAAGLPEDKFPEVIIPEVFTPANYNNPDLIDKLTFTSNNIIGEGNVIEAEALMVGEDFSRYGLTEHKVPAALFWLGTISTEKKMSGNLPGLHSPFYYPEPKESISTGVKVMSEGLIGLFNN